MRIVLLGVPIDGVTRSEAAARLATLLEEPRGHLVTTPNPEMLVEASRNPAFRDALSRADLAVPDGVGLVLVARLRGLRLPERVSGTDLVEDLAAIAARAGRTMFLLGGERPDVAKRAAEALVRRHPGLKVVGAESGGAVRRSADGGWRLADDVAERLRRAAPDVLLVAFGHGKQEEWIAANLAALPSVRLAIGVGGAFDFIAGDVRRAPAWMRRIGLEWLWRLMVQPWRWRRIWRAVAVFPYLALRGER